MSLYPTTTDRPSRLLCVFAHPDDEIFCAGETLASWVEAGGEAMVFSATRGEAGQIQDARAATRQTLGAVRERELREACAELGVQRVECLDLGDGRLSEVGEERLAHMVAARIREFAPDVVITFGPDGGYGHPDHIAISAATTRACQIVASSGNRAPHLYYSAFPAQHRLICRDMAHWLTVRGADFHGSAAFVRALALLADEATTLQYADDALATQWFPEGFAIVEQSEVGTSLYLIISGRAEVVQQDMSGSRQVLQSLGPGQFFGARALASGQPYDASVLATETVTCLVFSARIPTAYDARGSDARPANDPTSGGRHGRHGRHGKRGSRERSEASAQLHRKVKALAAHRTQFAFEASMFSASLLPALLGDEYFEQVAFTTANDDVATMRGAVAYGTGQALRAS